MSIKQAIQDAKNNDLQEAILKLCKIIETLEADIEYIKGSMPN